METADMPLAAYLSYKGFGLEEVKNDEANPRKRLFVFSRKQGVKIEDEVGTFYAKTASVEPIKYFNEIKLLKNRLYS